MHSRRFEITHEKSRNADRMLALSTNAAVRSPAAHTQTHILVVGPSLVMCVQNYQPSEIHTHAETVLCFAQMPAAAPPRFQRAGRTRTLGHTHFSSKCRGIIYTNTLAFCCIYSIYMYIYLYLFTQNAHRDSETRTEGLTRISRCSRPLRLLMVVGISGHNIHITHHQHTHTPTTQMRDQSANEEEDDVRKGVRVRSSACVVPTTRPANTLARNTLFSGDSRSRSLACRRKCTVYLQVVNTQGGLTERRTFDRG